MVRAMLVVADFVEKTLQALLGPQQVPVHQLLQGLCAAPPLVANDGLRQHLPKTLAGQQTVLAQQARFLALFRGQLPQCGGVEVAHDLAHQRLPPVCARPMGAPGEAFAGGREGRSR